MTTGWKRWKRFTVKRRQNEKLNGFLYKHFKNKATDPINGQWYIFLLGAWLSGHAIRADVKSFKCMLLSTVQWVHASIGTS